ncbi:sensor histidine kinase [Streptomyces sp. NPDC046977]|uniref:sensor histidine kinase n=1 Tax=Streptomyces sp. NPDC046977 TaxID=3154703 RepID=UPI0033C58504
MAAVRGIRVRRGDVTAVAAGAALLALGLAELYVPLAPYTEDGPDLHTLSPAWLTALTVLFLGYGLGVAACTAYPRGAAALTGLCFGAQIFTPVLPVWPIVPLLALLGAAFGCIAVGGRNAPLVAATCYFVPYGIQAVRLGNHDWVFIVFVALAVMGPAYAVRMRRAQAARLVAAAVEREAAARADERLRVARELHDIVSHGVTVMVLQAGAAQATLDSDTGQAHTALDAVQDVGRDVVSELRRLLVVLRGTGGTSQGDPEQLPSLRNIDVLLTGVRTAGGRVEVAVDGDLGRVPAAVDVSGYRVLQEALTNAAKHAPGSTVSVRVEVGRDALRVRVSDDGRGTSRGGRHTAGSGHGLTGIKERAELFGGTADTGPREGGGFGVDVELPLNGAAVVPAPSRAGAPA